VKILSDVFEPDNLSNRIHAKDKLIHFNIKNKEMIQNAEERFLEFINGYNDISSEIIPDMELIHHFCRTLPHYLTTTYEVLRVSVESLSLYMVFLKLRENERIYLQNKKNVKTKSAATTVQPNNPKKGKTCFNCNRTGHMKVDYFRPGGDKYDEKLYSAKLQEWATKYRWKNFTPKANNTNENSMSEEESEENDGENSDDEVSSHLTTERANNTSEENLKCPWIIDSGASSHMYPHRDAFINYEVEMSYRTVHLSDNSEIPILGHGEIMLNFRVGSEKKPCILKKVLHVGANT